MLWEYNQIKDKFGTEIAGFVRAFDARLGVGLGSEIDDGLVKPKRIINH